MRGFTLIELMLVVGIVGIIAAMSVNLWGTFIPAQQLKAAARGIQNAIATARAQAVLSSGNVAFTVANGRIYAFKDANNDGRVGAEDVIYFQYPDANSAALPARIVFSSQIFSQGTPSASTQLYFNYEGLCLAAGNLVSGVICVTDTILNQKQAVQMTVAGACRIQQLSAATLLCP